MNQSFLEFGNGEKRGEGERLSKGATFVGPNWSCSLGVEMGKLSFNGDWFRLLQMYGRDDSGGCMLITERLPTTQQL